MTQMLLTFSVFLTLLVACLSSSESSAESHSVVANEFANESWFKGTYDLRQDEVKSAHSIGLVGWRFHEIGGYFTTALFFLAACLAKIVYHNLDFLQYHVPESCVLIVLGTAIGLLFHALDYKEHMSFESDKFLFVLLPPIILESAYSLHDKVFFQNFKTIILYAVAGTLINVALIGVTLFGLSQWSFFPDQISLIECFTFSTIISAVDPVAVLAIFHEIGVNKSLYFLVFGESLLNDAVVIVLYGTVTTFAAMHTVTAADYLMGLLSFFTVSGGGLVIGILTGGLTALMTRTTADVRVVEPFLVIVMAYTSYVFAELFHFSGIISLIACGLVQYQYIADNISTDSLTTIKYFVKTMSSVSDVIIFFYLGRVLVRDTHSWSSSFVFMSTFLCVLYRFVSTFFLTAIANSYMQSLKRISWGEQLIMAYGGLRGAIAFSLVLSLDGKFIPHTQLFLTATLFIILFTVFILGITTKPMIKFLDVKLLGDEEEDATGSMFIAINERIFDTIMSAVAEISDVRSTHSVALKFHRINDNILKRFLTVGEKHSFEHTYDAVKWKQVRRSHRKPNTQSRKDSVITMDHMPDKRPVHELRQMVSSAESVGTNDDSVFEEVNLRNGPEVVFRGSGYNGDENRNSTPSSLPQSAGHLNRNHSLRHTLHHHSALNNWRNVSHRTSYRSRKKVVASMFSQNQFYHLPRRDSIVSTPTAAAARSRAGTESGIATAFHFPSRQSSHNTDM